MDTYEIGQKILYDTRSIHIDLKNVVKLISMNDKKANPKGEIFDVYRNQPH